MKLNIVFPALFMLAFATGSLSAQPGGGWQNQSPEQRADQQVALMTEKIALSEAQAVKIREITLKYSQKMQEARQANPDGDREKMRETMTVIRSEQDKEYQTILTAEQWQNWLKVREEMMQSRGRRPGGPEQKREKTDN